VRRVWYGFALKDEQGKWLTKGGEWTRDFARAAVSNVVAPVSSVLKTFDGDKVSVRAVRVKVTMETEG